MGARSAILVRHTGVSQALHWGFRGLRPRETLSGLSWFQAQRTGWVLLNLEGGGVIQGGGGGGAGLQVSAGRGSGVQTDCCLGADIPTKTFHKL